MRRALVMGFFCTIGDVDSLRVVRRWLEEAEVPYTVAPFGGPVLSAIPGAVPPETVDPRQYTHVIVVCGPCSRWYYALRHPINAGAFSHCHFIGVDLSMIEPVSDWNPFDTLLERNSDRIARPDLSLAMERPLTPVFGLCLVSKQPEYGDRQLHGRAEQLLRAAAANRDAAVVPIDTGWPAAMNCAGLESEAQIEALIARMDLLLTTRLHGLVYALKHGVPALALDPIADGDKVMSQARTLGWPHAYLTEEATEETLSAAIDFCLSPQARAKARECAAGAKDAFSQVRSAFMAALERGPGGAADRWPAPERRRRGLLTRARGVSRRWLRALGQAAIRLAEQG